jgi:hypothetical protein
MFTLTPRLLLLLALIPSYTLAQTLSQWDLSGPAEVGRGRIGVLNRNIASNAPDQLVNFHIAGLANSTTYLEFQAETRADNATLFRLTNYHGMSATNLPVPFNLGRGEFGATWNGGSVNVSSGRGSRTLLMASVSSGNQPFG